MCLLSCLKLTRYFAPWHRRLESEWHRQQNHKRTSEENRKCTSEANHRCTSECSPPPVHLVTIVITSVWTTKLRTALVIGYLAAGTTGNISCHTLHGSIVWSQQRRLQGPHPSCCYQLEASSALALSSTVS